MKKTILISLIISFFTSCVFDKPEEKIFEKVEFPIVKFTINPNKDTTIFGIQGTRVFIGSNTFQMPDESIAKDSIKIELKEFYNTTDITLADLSTESDGKLIETNGMINISAISNGQNLSIKKGKEIVIHFPKKKNDNRKMNLFYADQSATDSSVSNWTVDSINLVKKTLKLGNYGWYYPDFGDSTTYDFTPKDYVDSGFYWNPLDFYISSYNFSEKTIKEVGSTMNRNDSPNLMRWNEYGVECDVLISMDGFIKKPRLNTKVSKSTEKEILKFLNYIPQLKPGVNKDGEIIQRRGLIFIQDGNVIPLYKTDEEYTKSFNNKYSKFEEKPIKNIDDAELNYFIFSVSKLGWINCDRFINSLKNVKLIANIPVNPNTTLKLAFSDINGVLKANIIDNQYIFSNVPEGEEATIIAIKNDKGQFSTAFKKVTIDSKPINDIKLTQTTLSVLRSNLEAI
jgi:hypothetical protein